MKTDRLARALHEARLYNASPLRIARTLRDRDSVIPIAAPLAFAIHQAAREVATEISDALIDAFALRGIR